MSQPQSPEPSNVKTPLITTEKKELSVKKAEYNIIEKHKSEEGSKERTPEKEDQNFEDCNDLVLVDNEEEKPVRDERSISPNVRDKMLDIVRPGTSPVVQKVRKSEYNKIGNQIREYQ